MNNNPQENPDLALDLFSPQEDKERFNDLKAELIQKSGCPDIRKNLAAFSEWMKQAKTFDEYLGYLSVVCDIDPYQLLAQASSYYMRGVIDSENCPSSIEGFFQAVQKITGSKEPRLRLTKTDVYTYEQAEYLHNLLYRTGYFRYKAILENNARIFLRLNTDQEENLIENLLSWIKRSIIIRRHNQKQIHIEGADDLQIAYTSADTPEGEALLQPFYYPKTLTPSEEEFCIFEPPLKKDSANESDLLQRVSFINKVLEGSNYAQQKILILLTALRKSNINMKINFVSSYIDPILS